MSTVEESPLGSVSLWINDLREGSEAAAANLFDRYFPSIRSLARRELGSFPTRAADDEDLAIGVINQIFNALRDGRLESMTDRQHMWALMVLITQKSTIDHKRFETRDKRNVNLQEDASPDLVDTHTSPLEMVAAQEQQERLFEMLRNDELRMIAAAKLEGYSNEEIAGRLRVSSRTIQRKVSMIYEQWAQELGGDVTPQG